jgi:hypothetical protein
MVIQLPVMGEVRWDNHTVMGKQARASATAASLRQGGTPELGLLMSLQRPQHWYLRGDSQCAEFSVPIPRPDDPSMSRAGQGSVEPEGSDTCVL